MTKRMYIQLLEFHADVHCIRWRRSSWCRHRHYISWHKQQKYCHPCWVPQWLSDRRRQCEQLTSYRLLDHRVAETSSANLITFDSGTRFTFTMWLTAGFWNASKIFGVIFFHNRSYVWATCQYNNLRWNDHVFVVCVLSAGGGGVDITKIVGIAVAASLSAVAVIVVIIIVVVLICKKRSVM